MTIPKTFISYSWDDEAHKNWVRDLATRLRRDGVETVLDRWHAVPGDQLPAFMEAAIRENDFVLMVCTPKYKSRFDGRGGGAGYEGDIIQAEVFVRNNSRKFIPVLRRGEWEEAAPSALLGKYKIDLREGEEFESNYQDLLRTLHGEREQPPAIGGKPEFAPASAGAGASGAGPPASAAGPGAGSVARAGHDTQTGGIQINDQAGVETGNMAGHTINIGTQIIHNPPAEPKTTLVREPDLRRPHELPPGAEEFFGREAELKELIQRLRARKNTAVVGAAGLGKTALAAKALLAVVGDRPGSVVQSPFPDGVVLLNLYTLRGMAEAVWDNLANKLRGAEFMERTPARDRATAACNARDILIVMEGGEEADGQDGRAGISELLSVLSPQNRWLLLTRLETQAAPAESVLLEDALNANNAGRLFDSITRGKLSPAVRSQALKLLQGHPLALTWAGNLLVRGDENPQRLLDDWARERLPALSDPVHAGHTLKWVFDRSLRGMNDEARLVLEAAGLLANSPFPFEAMTMALGESKDYNPESVRRALRDLVQRSLLRRVPEADSWQFTHVFGYQFARKETGSDAGIRAGLGRWLHTRLTAELAAGQLQSIADGLEHFSSLLRADDDASLWRPLAQDALYDFADRLNDLGGLVQLKLLLAAVAHWLAGLGAGKAQEPRWLREKSALGNRYGDALVAQGDLAGAQISFREAQQVSRRLADSDPSNTLWQHDLSVSYNKVGNVLMDQGDLAGALTAYREMLQVIQRLADSDPSIASWQRDLSVSHNKVGDVLIARGDLDGALTSYREAQQVIRRLADSAPSNAGWQRDLSVSHNKVGEVLKAQGDLAGALTTYRESLQVRRRLADAAPSNAVWQRDLSVSHSKVGDVLKAQGDLAGALTTYRESLQVMQRLADVDPSNAIWQRDLSYSRTRMAELHEQAGDYGEALRLARESLSIAERLAALDPTNVTWQKDVVFTSALVKRLENRSR